MTGKASKRAFRAMQQKIKESKQVAKRQLGQMRYNSKPLENVGQAPASNITYATTK